MKKIRKIAGIAFAVMLSVIISGCVVSRKQTVAEMPVANRVQIGWAKRSIAAPGNVPITGQSNLRIALGEYSPVLVSAMAMSNSEDAVIFVSLDVVSVNNPVLKGVVEILKKEAPEIPASKIIVNGTHSHTGPTTSSVNVKYPNKIDIVKSEEYLGFIIRNTADAIKEAWNNRADGSVAYGYGFATVGFSRRALYLDDTGKRLGHKPGYATNGHCVMYGKTNDSMFAGYEAGTDTFINILYTFDADGKLNGAVVNIPCPAQNFESAWMYYAGFWANVRDKLKAEYGEIGLICQSAPAGDLAPRQLHYNEAEFRRYALKYPELIEKYKKNPMVYPPCAPRTEASLRGEILEIMRSEDASERIMAAFKEVLQWASKDKKHAPVLKHNVKTVKLDRCILPESILKQEEEYHKDFMKQSFLTEGDEWIMLIKNSQLNSKRSKVSGVINRVKQQANIPAFETEVHVVRIGDIAFATNRFELFMDYMHRIQGRSPFVQTFVVELSGIKHSNKMTESHSYLPIARAEKNRGYSATLNQSPVSSKGGQELVDATVKGLKELYK